MLSLHLQFANTNATEIRNLDIEEALEIHGIQYISTPRPNRRGGGAAINPH